MPINSSPLKSWKHSLQGLAHRLVDSFSMTDFQAGNQWILPLKEVERQLHDHYVSMEALEILFEYYEPSGQMNHARIKVRVLSPVQGDRSILLQVVDSQVSFQIETQQILSISGND